MIYQCCDDRRREIVHAAEKLGFNGIDFIDVVDGTNGKTLKVYFVNPLQANALGKANILIDGGVSICDVAATSVQIDGRELIIHLNKHGDTSRYTLRLNSAGARLRLDPRLSEVSFTFTLPHLDNKAEARSVPPGYPEPEIDYLAKDYTSFRQLMLDRLATLLPEWSEPDAADIGVMLVEILAYVADHLSYQQDVLATEAYLNTARNRVSIRRHARLLDYFISEGCNARVWAQVRVTSDDSRPGVKLPKKTQLLTGVGSGPFVSSNELKDLISRGQAEVFETLHSQELFAEHNSMSFYTWGAQECCLPTGATSATLKGRLEHLKVGDVLIFQEMCDPHTGNTYDADPHCRHAVRLIFVDHEQNDPLGRLGRLGQLGQWPDTSTISSP
ncbi:MAG: putative baseplate assembly protein, partial [Chloroflexota bacterium]|nr:putative baseplate assembly protein [Chloroflexota bacterium]